MHRQDPQLTAGELTTLTEFLDFHRATLLWETEGLDAAGLNRRLPTSPLTLGGLLKHLALVEDIWFQSKFLGKPAAEPWASAPWDSDHDWDFHSAERDDPDELRSLYLAACERSRNAVAGANLDTLSIRSTSSGEHWSLRWILVHMIEETSRHNGHADLLREAIDGSTGE